MANNLIRVIESVMSGHTFSSPEERIVVSCVTYKYIEALNSSGANNDLRQLVMSYAGNIKNKVIGLKNKYISYDEMINTVKTKGKTLFTQFNTGDIDEIYKLYLNQTVIKPFDVYNFDPSMYKITKLLSYKEREKLLKVHRDVVCPIIKYYMNMYNIPPSCMEVISAITEDGACGKEIVFGIKGISSYKILNDIKTKSIFINYYSATTKGEYVRIVLK